MALKHIRQCPECETKLFEGGKYCPCCGHEFDEVVTLTKEQIADSGFRGFCQHPLPYHALLEPHLFCPYCRGQMHLYIDALEATDAIAGSEYANIAFRVRKVNHEPITFLSAKAACKGEDLDLGRRRIYADVVLRENGEEVEIDFHYNPGEEAGIATIDVELIYMVEGRKLKVQGTHDLNVAHTNKNLPPVTFNVEGHLIADDINVFGRKENPESFTAEAVEQQREGATVRYVPLICRQTVLDDHVEPPDEAAADQGLQRPDWAPTQSARIWFETAGRLYNYCLLTQPSMIFGRRESECDVRLLEVELCLANYERQAREGVPEKERISGSYVSARQWQMEPTSSGIRLTQIGRSSILKPGDKTIDEGQVCILGHNDSIEMRGRVGLRYAANAPGLEEIHDWYMTISKILDHYVAPWSGDYGGYRLDRLYSLCDDLPDGLKNYNTIEHYILMPGWCTIGSSPEACIHIPDYEVAAMHAHLLFGAGYFFIVPASGARVEVDENALPEGTPTPVGFKQSIKLGNTTLVFDEFSQLLI